MAVRPLGVALSRDHVRQLLQAYPFRLGCAPTVACADLQNAADLDPTARYSATVRAAAATLDLHRLQVSGIRERRTEPIGSHDIVNVRRALTMSYCAILWHEYLCRQPDRSLLWQDQQAPAQPRLRCAANNALWVIANVRTISDPRTRAFVAKRTATGTCPLVFDRSTYLHAPSQRPPRIARYAADAEGAQVSDDRSCMPVTIMW